MNPGELREKISVLEVKQEGNAYSWEELSGAWAKVEYLSGRNLFSLTGVGVKSVEFTIRKNKDLTKHNAFCWNGRHCFLTDIKDAGKGYQEVTAALVEPVQCKVNRTGEPTMDSMNRPVYPEDKAILFHGCMVEKYIRNNQDDPMAVKEAVYTLVIPKVLELAAGELVVIADVAYRILVCHTLDEYKNEYEIMFEGDV